MKKTVMVLLLVLLCLCGCGEQSGQKEKQSKKATKEIFAMDTYMTITTYGEKAEEAATKAVSEIERLDNLLSTGKNESEIAILNENGSEIVSEDTAQLIAKSIELYQDTNGVFDISIYPLMKEWGFTTKKYKVPSDKTINHLLKNIEASKIEWNNKTNLVALPEEMEIDLGGIAKGYTSNRLTQIFKEYQLTGGVLSLGGNVQTYGTKEDGGKWKIAIENPSNSPLSGDYLGVLKTGNMAVITSGGYERYFEKNGKTYHHILDPATGKPANHGVISATIVSKDGTLADGLSTSLFIMGKDEDEKIKQASLLIQRHGDNPHVELYIFSDSIESSLLTQTMQPKGMKVRRISDAKSLINDILYRNGSMLFEQADGSADKNKDISAVVLGLGSYGTQMLKALPWFGQMDGYNLTITAVDLQRDAADRFAFQCPELC